MAKDRRKVIHIHSSIEDRQPTPQSLEYGELGVNYNAGNEFISTKNSDDKVVRFSSDEQIVTIMEKKEVMPYEGMVRGEVGPDGTKDGKGSYGITNDDLLNNKSNIVIKLNQVAASNTTKHDKVNGSKDIYNKLVNPTEDSGLNDGAGFAIDMSRYAMIDANPSFSSLTVTDKTDLSGNTTIGNGDGTGTRTGHSLSIQTTDVFANDTNWTEKITNKTATITNKSTTATTTVYSGNTSDIDIKTADYSGDTFNGHIKDTDFSGNTVDITANTATTKIINSAVSAQTADYSGNTFNSHVKAVTHSGDTLAVTETSTDITSCNRISANTNDFEIKQCTSNAEGKFIVNEKSSIISGDTMVIDELASISAKTPTTTISGTNFTLNESNTVISSCTKVDIITDDLNIKQCSAEGGSADFEFCTGYNVKSNAVKIEECDNNEGSIIIKENATNISGKTLTIRESGATDFSGATLTTTTTGNTIINSSADTNIITVGNTAIHSDGRLGLSSIGELSAVSTESDMIITANGNICESAGNNVGIAGVKNTYIGQTCGGENTTTGNTVIYGGTNVNISGTTITESGDTVNITGDTTLNLTGDTVNVDASTVDIDASANVCISATTKANFYGGETNIGVDCNGSTTAATINVSGTTINEGGTTINETFTNGNLNITNYDLNGSNICISGSTKANLYGATTNIGVDCNGSTTAATINVSGTTINEGGTTINENATNYNGAITNYNLSTTNYTLTGNTINEYGNTVNISGKTTNITGDTNLNMTGADVCIYGTNEASLGAATVNVGTNCDSTTVSNNINIKSNNNINVTSVNENHTATTINSTSTNYNVTANTETHTTTSFTLNTTDVCLNASSAATVGGDISTNIGANCAGTPISNTTNIYGDTINNSGATINSSATTINNNATTINNSATTYNITATSYFTGDVHIDSRSKLYLTPDCTSDLTSTTVNAALCEVFTRGEVTMTKDANPSDIRLSAIYRLYQNGEQIGDDINVPKDGFLKGVELVNVNNIYYLRFTWNIYDSDTGTYRTGTTDVNVEDLVKDIDENNTNTGRGVDVDVWYNETAKKMNVSATTTVVINNADGTGTKKFSKSNAVNSLTSYTLNSTSGDVKSTEANTNWTYDPFAEKKNIVVPTDASHINRKTVSWSYGSVTGATGGSYDPGDGTVNTTNSSRTMSFVIPQYLKDLNNNLSNLKFNTGTTNVSDSPYNGSVEKTITIPSSIDHLDEWNGECFTIPHNLCVDGTITAGGSIYSTSDERKKQDIQHIALDDKLKVRNIPLKSFAFKDDPQRKVYGVIAQEVEAAGLNELIHTDEEGMLSVDYTSFLILRIAYLEKLLGQMHAKMAQFEEKINKK